MVCLKQAIFLQIFQRLSSTNFTWSILECFVPNAAVVSRVASVGVDEIMPTNFKDLLIESKLILAKFTFEKLSLALHSRGKCLL